MESLSKRVIYSCLSTSNVAASKQPLIFFFLYTLAKPIHFLPKYKASIFLFSSQETSKNRYSILCNLYFLGHKIKPQYDFDFVALDLLSVYPEDSGTYTCTARNALGEATTSATVKIAG